MLKLLDEVPHYENQLGYRVAASCTHHAHSAVDVWGVIGDVVSLLSGPQHFGVCILDGKKKAFVSERWTCIFLGLSFGPWYLCACNEFSVLSCKEKEIVDQIRASCWCLVYRDWGKLQWGIGVDPDYLSNKLRDSVYIALDSRILKFYRPSNQICCIQKMWGTVWVNYVLVPQLKPQRWSMMLHNWTSRVGEVKWIVFDNRLTLRKLGPREFKWFVWGYKQDLLLNSWSGHSVVQKYSTPNSITV